MSRRWIVVLVLVVGCARDNAAFDLASDPQGSTGKPGASDGPGATSVSPSTTAVDDGAVTSAAPDTGVEPTTGVPDTDGTDSGPIQDCPNGTTAASYNVTIDTFVVALEQCLGECDEMNYGGAATHTLAGTDADDARMLLKFDLAPTAVVQAATLTLTADVSLELPASSMLRVHAFDDTCDWLEGPGPRIMQPEIDGTPTYNNCWFPDGEWPGGSLETAVGNQLAAHGVVSGPAQALVWNLDPVATTQWLESGRRSLVVWVAGATPGTFIAHARESGTDPKLSLVTCDEP
jgi:hypothetical protein